MTPQNEQELLQNTHAIAGKTLGQLASQLGWSVPVSQQRAKGWVGQLLERILGANAGTLPLPDFKHLGIELKTLPLNEHGEPQETTFVCSIALLRLNQETWDTSLVLRKLARVLWVPVEAVKTVSIAQRRIGSPILWSPSTQQMQQLKQDWQELTDMINLGQLELITGRHGRYLQVRPKAANSQSLCWGIGADGSNVLTLPRGFYLRTCFTRQLLSYSSTENH